MAKKKQSAPAKPVEEAGGGDHTLGNPFGQGHAETIRRADGTVLGVVIAVADIPSMEALAVVQNSANEALPFMRTQSSGGMLPVEDAKALDTHIGRVFDLVFKPADLPAGARAIGAIERMEIAMRFFGRLLPMLGSKTGKPRGPGRRAKPSSSTRSAAGSRRRSTPRPSTG